MTTPKPRTHRLRPTSRIVLLWLCATARPGSTTTTAPRVAEALALSPGTVRAALAELTAAGIIAQKTSNAGIRVTFCTPKNDAPPATADTIRAILCA